MLLHIDGQYFKDEHGRIHILRGVNLGGSSKTPRWSERVGLHEVDGSQETFIGRPLPLAEADEHFERLKAWGLTFLRFLVTWEAIEHQGPGIYDEAYLDYLEQIIAKAGAHGFTLFVDFHQDVWSRWASGDGAPRWTFTKVGLDPEKFNVTGAAVDHPIGEQPHNKVWPANYTKLASATMFTLFFGGNDFAPQTMIAGEPAQAYLQRHYIGAVQQVVKRLKDMPHVIGYGTMNEPSMGFIGWQDLTATDGKIYLRSGPTPNPLQAMALGCGIPQTVENWGTGLFGPRQRGTKTVNEAEAWVWLDGFEPIWKQNGVWAESFGEPHLLRPDHFTQVNGQEIDFGRDYLRPFINRYAAAVREINPDAIIFAQTTPLLNMPEWGEEDAQNIVNAAHWYDYFTLFLRLFLPFFTVDIQTSKVFLGRKKVLQSFVQEIAKIKKNSAAQLRGAPTLLGEFGIPFNMPLRLDYRLNWFGNQIKAYQASYQAVEKNLVSGTMWNYTYDNSNKGGDGWNGEDLSLFSADQQKKPSDLNSGGRALKSVIRPYPLALSGEPLGYSFDPDKKIFELSFRNEATVTAPTEIFVPTYQYPNGYKVTVSDGTFEQDTAAQKLIYRPTIGAKIHYIFLSPL